MLFPGCLDNFSASCSSREKPLFETAPAPSFVLPLGRATLPMSLQLELRLFAEFETGTGDS